MESGRSLILVGILVSLVFTTFILMGDNASAQATPDYVSVIDSQVPDPAFMYSPRLSLNSTLNNSLYNGFLVGDVCSLTPGNEIVELMQNLTHSVVRVLNSNGVELVNLTLVNDLGVSHPSWSLELLANVTGDSYLEILLTNINTTTVPSLTGTIYFEVLDSTLCPVIPPIQGVSWLDNEPDGMIDGTGTISAVADIDADGHLDLITQAAASRDGLPRGIYVYNLTDCSEKWRFETPSIAPPILYDKDGDGKLELAAGSYAAANCGPVNGFSSEYSYVYEWNSSGDLTWFWNITDAPDPLYDGVFTGIDVTAFDWNADNILDLIITTRSAWHARNGEDLGGIYIFDGANNNALIKQLDVGVSLEKAVPFIDPLAPVPSSPEARRLAISGRFQTIEILDQNLSVIKKKHLDSRTVVDDVQDLDDDGLPEFILHTVDPAETFILDWNLSVVWSGYGSAGERPRPIMDLWPQPVPGQLTFVLDGVPTIYHQAPVHIAGQKALESFWTSRENRTITLNFTNILSQTIDISVELITPTGLHVEGPTNWDVTISSKALETIIVNISTLGSAPFGQTFFGLQIEYEDYSWSMDIETLVSTALWWNPDWEYRIPIMMRHCGKGGTSVPVAIPIELPDPGLGENWDNDSFRLVLVDPNSGGPTQLLEHIYAAPRNGTSWPVNGTLYTTIPTLSADSPQVIYIYYDTTYHAPSSPPQSSYFLPPVSLVSLPGGGSLLQVADFTGDQRDDIVVSCYDDSCLQLLSYASVYNSKKGFLQKTVPCFIPDRYLTLETGDFSGDGLNDLAGSFEIELGGIDYWGIILYEGASPMFSSYLIHRDARYHPSALPRVLSLQSVDFNGDDILDLVGGGDGFAGVIYEIESPWFNGPLTLPHFPFGNTMSPMIAGKTRSEGFDDIIFGNDLGSIYVLDNIGSKLDPWTPGDDLILDTPSSGFSSMTSFDFDGDGYDEIVALAKDLSTLYLIYTPKSTPELSLFSVPEGVHGLVPVHLNEDQYTDLILYSTNSEAFVLFGNANGFSDLTSLDHINLAIQTAVTADLNNDIYPDLVFISELAQTLFVSYGYGMEADFEAAVAGTSVWSGKVEQNQAPQVILPPLIQMNEDETLLNAIDMDDIFVDPEGGELTFGGQASTTVGIQIRADGTLDLIPIISEWSGSTTIDLWAVDSVGNNVSTTLPLRVLPINDPPWLDTTFFASTTFIVEEDATTLLNISARYGDIDTSNESLQLTTNSPFVAWDNVSLTLNANFSGEYSSTIQDFTLFLSDGQYTVSTIVTVYIQFRDDPPILTPLPLLQIIEDDSVAFSLLGYVSDPDTSIGEFVVVAFCSIAEVYYDPSNFALVFTHNKELTQSIIDICNLQVSDLNNTSEVSFSVELIPVNDPPYSIGDHEISFLEDTSQPLNLNNHFSDPDSVLSFWVESLDINISVDIIGHDTCILQPKENWCKMQLITVWADDGEFNVSKNIMVTVKPVNDRPTSLSIPDVTIEEDGSDSSLIVSDYFFDVDSELQYSCSLGYLLDAYIRSDGKIVIEGKDNENGEDQIWINATDGNFSESQLFRIHILPVDDPPVINKSELINYLQSHFPLEQEIEIDISEYISDIDGGSEAKIIPSGENIGVNGYKLILKPKNTEEVTLEFRVDGQFVDKITFNMKVDPISHLGFTEKEWRGSIPGLLLGYVLGVVSIILAWLVTLRKKEKREKVKDDIGKIRDKFFKRKK